MPQVAETAAKKPILRPQFKLNSWAAKVAAIVLVLFFVGLATPPALASSLPGDALYPMKRGLENVELVFAGDFVGQVNVHLAHSERRIDESEQLLDKSRFESTVMQDALNSLDSAIQVANEHDLFTQFPELEARAAEVFGSFNTTLASAEAANLVDATEAARLETSQSTVMAYLPSQMVEPSNSSEVTGNVEPTEAVSESSTLVVDVRADGDTDATTAEATTATEEALAYVNAEGNVNVREGAGTAYAIIARLSPSTAVTTLGISGDWTQVRLADGRLGWIANFLLSDTEPVFEETSILGEPETGETTTNTDGGDTTGSTTTSSSGSGTSNNSNPECERGRSCDAPGQSNGNGGNGSGGGGGRDN